jgi:4-oxalocrotonate tautomerase
MPIVRVEMLMGRTEDQKRELARVMTAETARITNCAEDQVQVIITEISPANWGLGGNLQGTSREPKTPQD